MTGDLDTLENWVGELMAKMDPPARRKLARAVAVDLRRAQADRIGRQQNPDGSPYQPRKKNGGEAIRNRKGKVRRRAEQRKAGPMFRKLRRAANLRAESNPSEAIVGFKNPTTSRIARVHQDGLRDKVSREAGAPEVRYPARVLLGFSGDDRRRLLDLVLAHIEA